MNLLKLLRYVVMTVLLSPTVITAQPRTEYRGFWVDTFNTTLNSHADVQTVVNNALSANANALFVQVRRRGDGWYLNSLEPPPDFVPIEPDFDVLQDLISVAHGAGLEVHAYVIVGAVWNKNPNFTPSPTLGPPRNPNHVFNLHGGYDAGTQTIIPGSNNWLTRTLLPDGSGTGTKVAFQGHRFGNDFWIDLGHPDAEAYSVNVLMHLVTYYDVDGLHLDRIRFPDFDVPGQTPTTGANIGYNAVSIARFQRANGIADGSAPPAPGDPAWAQWRRTQVTNFVRRLYLNAIAARPQLRLSASLIAYGGGPTTEAAWNSAEAFWRVYQDWRAWTEEGIIDIAVPMNYKREHTVSHVTMYNTWNEWTKNHAYDRATMVGLGSYLNGVEGTLRQVRRALEPSATGNFAAGVTFFSMANPSAAVTANPFSIPPGLNTPKWLIADFAAGLVTGKSADGLTPFEDPLVSPQPIFGDTAFVPVFPWKSAPAVGHLKGVVRDASGAVVDTGAISIARIEDGSAPTGRTTVATATDGGGFYGGVDLAPGRYQVTVTPVGKAAVASCHTATVAPGQVTALDVTFDEQAPAITFTISPGALWPPDHRLVPITAAISASDNVELSALTLTIADEYGQPVPTIEPLALSGTRSAEWGPVFGLVAARGGEDLDGRTYTLIATAVDCGGHSTTATATVVVPHDQGLASDR